MKKAALVAAYDAESGHSLARRQTPDFACGPAGVPENFYKGSGQGDLTAAARSLKVETIIRSNFTIAREFTPVAGGLQVGVPDYRGAGFGWAVSEHGRGPRRLSQLHSEMIV